jgi:hypothetical protein
MTTPETGYSRTALHRNPSPLSPGGLKQRSMLPLRPVPRVDRNDSGVEVVTVG